MMVDVEGKTRAAVAALLDLSAELEADSRYVDMAADLTPQAIRQYAEALEYRYAPAFVEESDSDPLMTAKMDRLRRGETDPRRGR